MGEEVVSGYDLAKVVEADIRSKRLFLEKSMPSDFAFTIHDKDDPLDGGPMNSPTKVNSPTHRGGFGRGTGMMLKRSEYGIGTEYAIGMTREFDGERIKVFVKHLDNGYDDYGYRSHGRRKKSVADQLKLDIKILKGTGKKLSFEVTASADEITIGSMTINVPTYDEDDSIYRRRSGREEYECSVDEDSDLQGVLREYLKIRGIKKSTIDFLFKYMDMKSKQQPMIALKNLQQFLKD